MGQSWSFLKSFLQDKVLINGYYSVENIQFINFPVKCLAYRRSRPFSTVSFVVVIVRAKHEGNIMAINVIIAHCYENTLAWKTHYVQGEAVSVALEWSRFTAVSRD